ATLRKAIILGTAAGLFTLILGGIAAFFLLPARQKPQDQLPAALHLFQGNAAPLWSLALSHDGKNLALGNHHGTVTDGAVSGDNVLSTLTAQQATVSTPSLSPLGDQLATGSDDGDAVIWGLKSQKQVHDLASAGGVRALAFDPEGKRLLTGGRNGSLSV